MGKLLPTNEGLLIKPVPPQQATNHAAVIRAVYAIQHQVYIDHTELNKRLQDNIATQAATTQATTTRDAKTHATISRAAKVLAVEMQVTEMQAMFAITQAAKTLAAEGRTNMAHVATTTTTKTQAGPPCKTLGTTQVVEAQDNKAHVVTMTTRQRAAKPQANKEHLASKQETNAMEANASNWRPDSQEATQLLMINETIMGWESGLKFQTRQQACSKIGRDGSNAHEAEIPDEHNAYKINHTIISHLLAKIITHQDIKRLRGMQIKNKASFLRLLVEPPGD